MHHPYNNKIVSINSLKAGDVLLCYIKKKVDPVGKKITKETDSDYVHAAICIDSTAAAESIVSSGVQKVPLRNIVCRYDHVAVFRQPDAWSQSRVTALNFFIDTIIKSGAKYNLSGVAKFRKRKELHDKTIQEQLEAFFKGQTTPDPSLKGQYFCSELVADCFVATEFIQPSAAVHYRSSTTSPGALGRDPTFGTFYGYLACAKNYQVPDSDEFINTTTYSEIYETKI